MSIRASLDAKYPGYLRPDIQEIEVVQLPDVCFLQVTRRTYPHARDEIVERQDLEIIGGPGDSMFPPSDSVAVNAMRFVTELDDYSIIMALGSIFTEEASQKIADEWERPGGKLDAVRPTDEELGA